MNRCRIAILCTAVSILIFLLFIFSANTRFWENFFPKITINKLTNLRVEKIATVQCASRFISFSNNKDKIAYLSNNRSFSIFDIASKQIKEYPEDKKNHFSSLNYGLVWSPDDKKMLLFDYPDLLVYDIQNNKKLRIAQFAEASHDFASTFIYRWVDSAQLIYSEPKKNPTYEYMPEYLYTVKDLTSGASKSFSLLAERPLPGFDSETPVNLTNYIRASVTLEDLNNRKALVEILIDGSLPSEYTVNLRSQSDVELTVKNPEISLKSIDAILSDPALSHFANNEQFKWFIKTLLKRFMIPVFLPDGTIGYREFKGVKSPDGKMAFKFNQDYSELWLYDLERDGIKKISLNKPEFKHLKANIRISLSERPRACWLSNQNILFLGNENYYLVSAGGIYNLNINSQEIRKYPNERYYPEFILSPDGEKVALIYFSDPYFLGLAQRFRYHNINILNKEGIESRLFSVAVGSRMVPQDYIENKIVKWAWDKNSANFYFIISEGKDVFEKPFAYQIWVVKTVSN